MIPIVILGKEGMKGDTMNAKKKETEAVIEGGIPETVIVDGTESASETLELCGMKENGSLETGGVSVIMIETRITLRDLEVIMIEICVSPNAQEYVVCEILMVL